MRISFDETTAGVAEAEEYLDIVDGFGNWPFQDGVNAAFLHCHAIGADNAPKEIHFLD